MTTTESSALFDVRSRRAPVVTDEAGWVEAVDRLAVLCGWRTATVRRAVPDGRWWSTIAPAGWPALVAWRPGAMVFAQLLLDGHDLTRQQADCSTSLAAAGAVVVCWRPENWPEIVDALAASVVVVGDDGSTTTSNIPTTTRRSR